MHFPVIFFACYTLHMSDATDGLRDFFDDRLKRLQNSIDDMPTVAEIGRITLVLHGLEEAIRETQTRVQANGELYEDLLHRLQSIERTKERVKTAVILILLASFVVVAAILL